jgi:hypothetical protein
MSPAAVERFVEDLVGDELHVKQIKSLTHGVIGALYADRAGVAAIGRAAARERDVEDKHAVKQFDRYLSNDKLDPTRVMRKIVQKVVGSRKEIVVAIDWTEYAPDQQATIVVSLITEHGRAFPLVWQTVDTRKLKSRRSRLERGVLWMLYGALAPDVRVTVLADRGFGDTGLYLVFDEKLHFDFVVRFKGSVVVENEAGEIRPAIDWVPPNGQARRLPNARLTRKRRPIAAVVVVRRSGMKEAWCLATSRSDDAATIAALYARRFDIEHSFRDQKDRRFGFGLYDASIGKPRRRDRMLLVLVIAALIVTLLGAAGERLSLDRKLKANTDSRRTHSLWRQGREYIAGVAQNVVLALKRGFVELCHALGSGDQIYATI